jgi:hypothetical protein
MKRQLVGHPNIILTTLAEACVLRNWEFSSDPEEMDDKKEWDNIWCKVWNKEFFGAFQVQQMPGCCAVLIVHHLRTDPDTREIFDTVLKMIEEAAFEAGFGSVMMAQVTFIDRKNQPVFKREPWAFCVGRWDMSVPFINAKSGNPVVYLTKNLGQ